MLVALQMYARPWAMLFPEAPGFAQMGSQPVKGGLMQPQFSPLATKFYLAGSGIREGRQGTLPASHYHHTHRHTLTKEVLGLHLWAPCWEATEVAAC